MITNMHFWNLDQMLKFPGTMQHLSRKKGHACMLFFRKSANGKKMFNKGIILENLGKNVQNLKKWKRASDCVLLLLHAINSYKRPCDGLKQKFKKYA